MHTTTAISISLAHLKESIWDAPSPKDSLEKWTRLLWLLSLCPWRTQLRLETSSSPSWFAAQLKSSINWPLVQFLANAMASKSSPSSCSTRHMTTPLCKLWSSWPLTTWFHLRTFPMLLASTLNFTQVQRKVSKWLKRTFGWRSITMESYSSGVSVVPLANAPLKASWTC